MPIELFEPTSPKFQERSSPGVPSIEWAPPEYEKPFAGNTLPIEPRHAQRAEIYGPRDMRPTHAMPNDVDGSMQVDVEGHESRWQKDGNSASPFRNVR